MKPITIVDIHQIINQFCLQGKEPTLEAVRNITGPSYDGLANLMLNEYHSQLNKCIALSRHISTDELFDLVVLGARRKGLKISHPAFHDLHSRLVAAASPESLPYEQWHDRIVDNVNSLTRVARAAILHTLEVAFAAKIANCIIGTDFFCNSLRCAVDTANTEIVGYKAYIFAAKEVDMRRLQKLISDYYTMIKLAQLPNG